MAFMKVLGSAARWLTSRLTFGRPVPCADDRIAEQEVIQGRISRGNVRFDDVKRLHALEELDGHWITKPFRVLMYKIGSEDD